MHILDLITRYWPVILILATASTGINQVIQRVIAPKYPRVGNIANTVLHDYVGFVLEVGGALKLGPRTKPEDKVKT